MRFNLINIFLVILFAISFSGCSSMSLTVNSVPEAAKVFIRPVGGGELVEIGQTPLILNKDQLKTNDAAFGPIFVEVQKENFNTERILVTEVDSVDMKLNFALEVSEAYQGMANGPGNAMEDAKSLNLAVDRLFEVRKFIALESYSEALNHLRYIEQTWPYLSATYEMKGGILFLQKKHRDALAAYALSLKYNPASVPSANMRDSLEEKLGIKGDELARKYEKTERAKVKRSLANSKNESVNTTKSKKKKRKKRKKKKKKKRRRK